MNTVNVDLEADLNARDHTGYCWSFLDEARDPSLIYPGAVIIIGDQDAAAIADVTQLEQLVTGTIVRFEILPGNIDQYRARASRLKTGLVLFGRGIKTC